MDAWYGDPADLDELDQRISRLHAACEAEGRDPGSLTLSAGVFVAFPHLLQADGETPPATAMRGGSDEVGAMMASYRDHAIDHLIVHLWPRTPEAVAELGRAAEVARQAVNSSPAAAQ